MRTAKIVADSSANVMTLNTVAFDAAPLKIITADREFVDNRDLDLEEMINAELPDVTVRIGKNLGLCSYYAEKGGLLVGFEKM